jgi:hypothetical protein
LATVTGTLTDFGLAALAAYSPQLIFTPSGPAINTTSLLGTRPITVTPAADGTFTVTLATTEDMQPATWYTISAQWLNSTGGYIGRDFPEWQLFVPTAGGNITALLSIPTNPAQVWVNPVAPANPTPGTWWLNPLTADLFE